MDITAAISGVHMPGSTIQRMKTVPHPVVTVIGLRQDQ
jgi:hypothetical protein